MKKLLLSSVAICGLALAASPALAGSGSHTGGVKLGLGGHFKGYVVWHDQDVDSATVEERSFDMLRKTQINISGETTLDNGLTVGAHFELDADTGDSLEATESYAYFSGGWGRVNLGGEDGAAYLLQVAAPSADSNVDGIRQYINPVNYQTLLNGGTRDLYDGGAAPARVGDIFDRDGLDYDNDLTTEIDKITYLTPILNGFQAGLSYTPDTNDDLQIMGTRFNSRGLNHHHAGVHTDEAGEYGEAYEAAARYEGAFDNVGVIVGAGYTSVQLENETLAGAGQDDIEEWNVGLDLDIGQFGVGAIYTENNNGHETNDTNETYVVGVDYTTGPFKLGASYLANENDINAGNDVDTSRYTGGVVYTYGPGMTFRGSISYVEHENSEAGQEDVEAASVLLGTKIQF